MADTRRRVLPLKSSNTFRGDRCIADFETAIENALSGYLSVAMDAMRDVMEIENLLLYFAVDPHHIDRWLQAAARTLRTTYSPAEVRNRLHHTQVGAHASSAEASEPTARPCTCVRAVTPSQTKGSRPRTAGTATSHTARSSSTTADCGTRSPGS